MHQNIRCLSNKINQVQVILNSQNIDILMLSEHWLSEEQIRATYLDGFSLASFSSREPKKHWEIKWKLRDDINKMSIINTIECCAVEINSLVNIVFIVIYRPPDADPTLNS